MWKKENNYVLSKGEDLKLFEDSLSEDEETIEVNGFEVLVSQVSKALFNSLLLPYMRIKCDSICSYSLILLKILRFDLLGSHLSGSQEKQVKEMFKKTSRSHFKVQL